MASTPTVTLWIWPSGLFPRRLIYYLRAKRLSLHTLRAHNIHLVPVSLQPGGTLAAAADHEPRPAGLSLPCMRIAAPAAPPRYVHESLAILEWLEDYFDGAPWPSLRGATRELRARSRDVLSVLAEAAVWANVAVIHSDPAAGSWSGLRAVDMSAGAAADAERRAQRLLGKVEQWVEPQQQQQQQGAALVGSGATLADFALMAMVMYKRDTTGEDWIAAWPALQEWCRRAVAEREWFVDGERLRRCEQEGWGVVLAEE